LGAAYGFIKKMDSAGAIVGPLAALALLGHFGIRGVLWAAALPGGLAILVALFGIRETRKAGAESIKEPSISPIASVAIGAPGFKLPRTFYYVLAVVTLFSLGNSSDMFLVLRAGNVGIPVAQAPLLGLVFNITYTLLSWPAGRFSDRFSRSTIAASGYFVFAVVYLLFALAPSSLAIWITMACYGLFYALTNPVLKALVLEEVAPEVRGRALGIYYFLTSVTTLLASVITGELWKIYGARVPFYFSSAIATVSAVLLLLHRNQPRVSATH
jgi:MFS family permease